MTIAPRRRHDQLLQLTVGLRKRQVSWHGVVYRSTTPAYASSRDMLSGQGSKMCGARWNAPASFPAVYASLTPETAMAECLAQFRYYGVAIERAMPRVFVGVRVRLQRVLDLTDGGILRALDLSAEELSAEDWRKQNDSGTEALTQAVGRAARTGRFEGLLAESAHVAGGRNLVIFPEMLLSRSRISIEQADQL